MKCCNRCIWAIFIGLSLAGCGLPSIRSQSPTVEASVQPPVNPPAVNRSAAQEEQEHAESQQPIAQTARQDSGGQDNSVGNSSLQQDYAPTAPLPETGKVTIRGHIHSLDPARLIMDCPTDSAPYAFAESSNYRIQICSVEYDPWLPKYYFGQAKDGSGEIRITNANIDEARQLIFKSDGYTYILYRDAAQPEQVNAYLQVFTPDGAGYAEALLYFYEASAPASASS